MKIYSVNDPEFKPYGRVVTGLEAAKAEILAALASTPLPAATDYVAEDERLQELPAAVEVSEHLFGGMPCQLGWCNGHNNALNCLEYHKSSELNLAADPVVLLLACQTELEDFQLNTEKVSAFFVPAGVGVELYATTLHYAPCHVNESGFQCVVVLPRGTNTEIDFPMPKDGEDGLMTAKNKWLIAHEDAKIEGAFNGLKGENITLD